MNNLLTGIYGKLTGSNFSSYVGGRVYLDRAPAGVEYPYCVFSIVSGNPDWTFKESFEDTYIQFSLFSASSSATEITTMYSYLKSLYDDCSMTITSNTLIWFRRQNLATMTEDITVGDATQQVRHWAVDYHVMTQAN